MDIRKRRFLLFLIGIVAFSITVKTSEKFWLLVGEEATSKSGQLFLNCFDMSSGTLSCAVQEGVKLYFYNIGFIHVETAWISGMAATEAVKQVHVAGGKTSKLAFLLANRIIGPLVASGWDFFEALYFGGTLTEGFLRGSGTFVGAYVGGSIGEGKFGRIGYLVGSHLGNWAGSRVGLMVYDFVSGLNSLVKIYQSGETSEDPSIF